MSEAHFREAFWPCGETDDRVGLVGVIRDVDAGVEAREAADQRDRRENVATLTEVVTLGGDDVVFSGEAVVDGDRPFVGGQSVDVAVADVIGEIVGLVDDESCGEMLKRAVVGVVVEFSDESCAFADPPDAVHGDGVAHEREFRTAEEGVAAERVKRVEESGVVFVPELVDLEVQDEPVDVSPVSFAAPACSATSSFGLPFLVECEGHA